MNTVYLDTETTGLSAEDEIVELTIIDDNGQPLINTLMKQLITQNGQEHKMFTVSLRWMLEMLLLKNKYLGKSEMW